MDNEIWCDVKGYEGRYQVSNLGNVKSLNYRGTGKEKILRQGKNTWGYLFVILTKNGEHKMYQVHRLILMTFNPVENMSELLVNHRDEDPTNNNLNNLEWCTALYNNTYNDRHKRVAEKNSIPIAQLTLDGKFVKAWKSSHEAEREGGFYQGAIIKCCKNKFNREGNNIYKGYRFMYLSEYMDKHNGIID